MPELIILLFILFCFVTTFIFLYNVIQKSNNSKQIFILKKRINNINFKKFIITYIIFQSSLFLFLLFKPEINYLILFTIPPILFIIVLLNLLFLNNDPRDLDYLHTDEFDEFKKQYIRDQKLEKLIGK